jgi:transposase-like protein
MQEPTTLIEAVRHYSDIDVCNEHLVRIKWPDGIIRCPKCGSENIGKIETRKMLRCNAKGCRKQFSYKVGTIFEDSPLGLDKWFVAIWCITNAKNGISSHELGRTLGVMQRTAWFMLHRIRLAMKEKSFSKISGVVEGDETFVGGRAKFMHPGKRKAVGRGTVGKAIVQGLLERGGEVRCEVVPNQKRVTLQQIIRDHVQPGATIYTDALKSYEGLDAEYVHQMIDHAKEYVRGNVHTNSMENFWCLLKRGLKGTYVAVSPAHLIRYVDEQALRFNKRHGTDATRFAVVMNNVNGRRLTYKELTGAE